MKLNTFLNIKNNFIQPKFLQQLITHCHAINQTFLMRKVLIVLPLFLSQMIYAVVCIQVVRLVLLWVNNHFSDFENDWKLMALLEKFDEKLKNSHHPSTGEVKLLKIACNAKAKKRCVHIVS